MRILTRTEIEEAEKEMVRIMAFHERLRNSRLLALLHSDETDPLRLAFDNRVTLTPMYDDHGSPGPINWSVLDRDGNLVPQLKLTDLIGCPVTGIGYMHDPCKHQAIPYLQFVNQLYVCCVTPAGGGVIRHDRPREDAWDVFPHFRIK